MKSIPELQTSRAHWTPKDTFDLYTARKQKQVPNSSCKLNCTQTIQLCCFLFGSGLFSPTWKASNTPIISLSQLHKSDAYRTLTREWQTHLLLPFVFGFLANKEGSSASRDLPLVLKSLWARSSRVLREAGRKLTQTIALHVPITTLNRATKLKV